MKLRTILISAFLLLSVVPVVAGLMYLNDVTSTEYRNFVKDHLHSISEIQKNRLISLVDRINDTSNLINSRTQLHISLSNWNNTQQEVDLQKIKTIIQGASNSIESLVDINIYDKKGNLVSSVNHLTSTESSQITDLIKRTTQFLKIKDNLVLKVSAPLIYNNTTVGYIENIFLANTILQIVRNRSGLGETGEWLFAVRDENGDALFAVPLKYDHKAAFKRKVQRTRLDVPITQALFGNEIIMENAPDYLENPVLASTRYIGKMDWGLVVKMHESEVNKLIRKSQETILMAVIILIVVSSLFGVLISFHISRPLDKLVKYIRSSMNEENPSSLSLPESSQVRYKEAKDLIDYFKRMLEKIKLANQNLEIMVEEKTAELKHSNQLLQDLAIEDPLTGLYNRRHLDDRLKQEISKSKRLKSDICLAVLDIDHFKSINDTYGHDAGDDVLKRLADYLSKSIRSSDVLARFGGEEFCIILLNCKVNSARAFLERLRLDIEELTFNVANKDFTITASFGVAELNEETTEPKDLFIKADSALYQAKKNGRNQVVLYDKTLIQEARPFQSDCDNIN